MIYPSILERKYQEYYPFICEASDRVKSTLNKFCEEKGYAFTSRIKSIESLAEKIETGRFKKWSDLNDLFACTVIIPTLSYEEEVIKFCKQTFEIVETNKKGQHKKDPDTFKFDSTRIYAQLKTTDDTSQSLLNISSITFEIQVKSAFEHAWSVATHDIVYKSSEIDWRRFRLAAQIKATVEQLDTLILAFEQTSQVIQDNHYPEIKIKQDLATEINKLFKSNKIPSELQPKDMSRLCNNLYSLLINADKEEKDIKKIFKQLTIKINSEKTRKIPLSISLFQYFLAILISDKIIEAPKGKYYCHITNEFCILYPTIKVNNNSIFLYDDIADEISE
jgi:ppGpp synthetase/RelA/SpoT-type nucleotidyltranferase